MKRAIEASYPKSFRKDEVQELQSHLAHHRSVVLIGMKRVGISNFLRFFLSHNQKSDQMFVQVDLNDLIERNISAFWTLLLTRVVDAVENSQIPEPEKKKCRRLFVQSIQLKDHFFTIESVRKVLDCIADAHLYPVLFFLRFDRLADAATPQFFSNLIGLRDGAKGKLSYVITSFRPIDAFGPVFAQAMYLPPGNDEDMITILKTLADQYHVSLDEKTKSALVSASGGYVQYLQLGIIALHEGKKISDLADDEQIVLQSEELFESLTKKEKEALVTGGKDRTDAEYLWNTGMIGEDGKFFSPLFALYVKNLSVKKENSKEFTKKEHVLFTFLKNHEGQLCERDAIIDAVWSESKEMGVSDWAIDRLVARLRVKLKTMKSPYSIQTVVTRGYKLVAI